MAVNSLTSGNNYVSHVQPQPQTQAERVAEQARNKERDDANKAAAANTSVQPTVNTNGQTVGTVVNVEA